MNTTNPPARSGRFAGAPSTGAAQFTESVSFDWRLWRQDIAGSIAHARMLHRIGLLDRAERDAIVEGLEAIAGEIQAGRFPWRADLEDVHMNIEAALTARTPAGAKLHTGRSRNDQVALDMRMWLRDELAALDGELRLLQRAMVELGQRQPSVAAPGYTHLQRAQPVYLAHHLLAYVEMIARDRQRLAQCRDRLNVCPLGAGALAGSSLALDREWIARELGFVDSRGKPRAAQNSMDAVSDRDFALEFCAGAAILAVHLSRLAEDIVIWSSTEFGYIRIDDAYTTGSSLMPQKKNPDIAELARGKSGRVIGNLMALLVLLKGLPMTYNRDLQEDKEPLFDTADTVRATARILAAMLDHSRFDAARCDAAARDPTLLATDLADDLVRQGIPFREAHHAVGAAVACAEQQGVPLDRLTAADFASINPRFGPGVHATFDLACAMRRRRSTGSTGTAQVRRQLRLWSRRLAKP
ncbi:MAG: argininosuccinate lyase [Verrucomicrobia bacterium]|nr:argininosuccinate lyase [Verrucomicrobiota bacterium]